MPEPDHPMFMQRQESQAVATDMAVLKADVAVLKQDVTVLDGKIEKLDGKIEKLDGKVEALGDKLSEELELIRLSLTVQSTKAGDLEGLLKLFGASFATVVFTDFLKRQNEAQDLPHKNRQWLPVRLPWGKSESKVNKRR